jgi:Flp pilus assembly protein TadG
MRTWPLPARRRSRGVAAIEFALVAMLFFTLLFSIIEFARLMYVYNSLQEVTRRAAREATVRWIDETDEIKTLALFGGTALPAGAEITKASITIEYLKADGTAVTVFPTDPGDNLSACGDVLRVDNCIYSVRVSIGTVVYTPMISLFTGVLGAVQLPKSTVTMHAESMGFNAS